MVVEVVVQEVLLEEIPLVQNYLYTHHPDQIYDS
jgi:hypothetical protein